MALLGRVQSIPCTNYTQLPLLRMSCLTSGTKKRGFSKRGFRRNSQIFITLFFMYYMYYNMAPDVATSDQPMPFSLSEFNMLFPGLSRLLAASALQNYLQTCQAQVQHSLRQNEKPLVQEQDVSVQTAMCIPKASCCATAFSQSATSREFPRLSATFREFPRLSATLRDFPPISARLSAPFACAVAKYPAIFRTISENFPQLSANSRSAVCSAPGERCGCCSIIRPIEGFPQQQSRLLMQSAQEMQCMTTIK